MIIRFKREEYDTDNYRDMQVLQEVLTKLEDVDRQTSKQQLAALFQEAKHK